MLSRGLNIVNLPFLWEKKQGEETGFGTLRATQLSLRLLLVGGEPAGTMILTQAPPSWQAWQHMRSRAVSSEVLG